MLHCPNENFDWHPRNEDISFFADAVVKTNRYGLVDEFIEYLPTPANCGHCMSPAYDDDVY